MHCDPACWGCAAAGSCPKEPAAPRIRQPRPWTPDRLTGQRAGCGHIIDVCPIVQDIFSLKAVWCEQCKPNRWVKPPAKRKTTTTRPNDGQEMIPF
jgi:hypothetical protein